MVPAERLKTAIQEGFSEGPQLLGLYPGGE